MKRVWEAREETMPAGRVGGGRGGGVREKGMRLGDQTRPREGEKRTDGEDGPVR